MQVHQLTQFAAEVSDAKHMQDPFNETANNELSGEHSEIIDDSGRALTPADEEIRKALDYVGADEEAQETLRECGITCLEEIIILNMSHLIETNMTIM